MKTITKALVGTVAAGAVAMASASPAVARDRYDRYRDHDGISPGEVIAGAVVLGGIAALAASSNDYRYNGYNGYRYNDYRYRGYYQNPRQAIEQCVYAAQRTANRYSYGGRSRVTDIRDIDPARDGFDIRGRIAVNSRNPYWYNGWGNDWRGWNNAYRGYDAGSFECKVRYGRVVDLDFRGIRGL